MEIKELISDQNTYLLENFRRYVSPIDYSKYLPKVFSSNGLTTKKQKKSRAASKRAKSARKK